MICQKKDGSRRRPDHRRLPYPADSGLERSSYGKPTVSVWADEQVSRIRAEGATITAERLAEICDRFRRRIGDSYALIADAIEHDHREKTLS